MKSFFVKNEVTFRFFVPLISYLLIERNENYWTRRMTLKETDELTD